jgi:hypothetical protein
LFQKKKKLNIATKPKLIQLIYEINTEKMWNGKSDEKL